MTRRATAPLGAPCWTELFTSDPEKAQIFYGELFGWTVDDPGPEYGGYVNFHKDGIPVGGCMRNDGSTGRPDVWTVYLATADAAGTVAAASAHGGSAVIPPMQVMALGTMALVADADGAGIGVWQPGEFPGFGVYDEPDTPGWFELHTRDWERELGFYRDVFGWDVHVLSDAPDFRYATLGEGDNQLAGVMDATSMLPAGAPAQWSIYFRVADTDTTLTRITDLGGAVVHPAEDTPYGRIAAATDPTGAHFKLVG